MAKIGPHEPTRSVIWKVLAGMVSVRAATLVAPGQIEIRQYPFPADLEPGAVLLRMIASGICGTDKHTFRGETVQYAGTAMERRTPFPIIQGHENLGIIEAVGPGGAIAYDATPVRAGDRVVPAPNRACGVCRNCMRGFPYYLCRNLENYGNSLSCAAPPHLFGGWAEFLYLRPGTPVFRVPADLPSEVAVLTEIFAVTHSLERAAAVRRPGGFRPGDTVAVVGVGSLGMAHLVKAALMGAGRVIAIDKSAKRLALAHRLVSADTVPAGDSVSDPAGAARAQVLDLTGGEGADVVVNATGFPGSFALATSVVRDAGTILEVGAFVDMGPEVFNPAVICGRSLTVMGTGGEDPQAYDRTLALLNRHVGAIPFAEMVSHTFRIGDAALALQTSLDASIATKVLSSPMFLPPVARATGNNLLMPLLLLAGVVLIGRFLWSGRSPARRQAKTAKQQAGDARQQAKQARRQAKTARQQEDRAQELADVPRPGGRGVTQREITSAEREVEDRQQEVSEAQARVADAQQRVTETQERVTRAQERLTEAQEALGDVLGRSDASES